MEWLLWVIIGILFLVILVFSFKVFIMRKSIKEIQTDFSEKLTTDTNTVISVSSNDKEIRKLAESINSQLKILREEKLKYQQGNTELKTAVTNIAHDLRTPLTAICGYLELLKNEEKSTDVERCLGIIEDRTDTLKHLTEELFRYSLIISQDDEVKNEEVCVNYVLEETIAAYYGALKEKNITPEVIITEKRIVRNLDKTALSRIFGNILSNAVKYSDGDLQIVLNNFGEITFSNTATGLDETQVAKLFDRFYTVENARTSTGLGLSIARTLVERMNGIISASYTNSKLAICIQFN
ncbi:MAG: HAMP domain-containing histidine kinase [Clostridia bacterium]|nr:HAMP domain-containing histidine kinase [Clostridia bacterium]